MSPLGLFYLSLPTNVIDVRYMESTGGKNSCTEEKNVRKPGKIWPLCSGGNPVTRDETQSIKPPMFGAVFWANV